MENVNIWYKQLISLDNPVKVLKESFAFAIKNKSSSAEDIWRDVRWKTSFYSRKQLLENTETPATEDWSSHLDYSNIDIDNDNDILTRKKLRSDELYGPRVKNIKNAILRGLTDLRIKLKDLLHDDGIYLGIIDELFNSIKDSVLNTKLKINAGPLDKERLSSLVSSARDGGKVGSKIREDLDFVAKIFLDANRKLYKSANTGSPGEHSKTIYAIPEKLTNRIRKLWASESLNEEKYINFVGGKSAQTEKDNHYYLVISELYKKMKAFFHKLNYEMSRDKEVYAGSAKEDSTPISNKILKIFIDGDLSKNGAKLARFLKMFPLTYSPHDYVHMDDVTRNQIARRKRPANPTISRRAAAQGSNSDISTTTNT